MDGEQPDPDPQDKQAGVGGGLRYLRETPTPRMVKQEHAYGCVIACVRQLLRDAGIELSERDLRGRIGVVEGFGSKFESAAEVLSELHPGLTYAGGSVNPEDVNILFQRDPWVARVRTLSGRSHAILVDGLAGGVVEVRDPWGLDGPGAGTGSEAVLSLGHFLEHWHFGVHGAIIPTGLKPREPS